jgi:hypothetical protein
LIAATETVAAYWCKRSISHQELLFAIGNTIGFVWANVSLNFQHDIIHPDNKVRLVNALNIRNNLLQQPKQLRFHQGEGGYVFYQFTMLIEAASALDVYPAFIREIYVKMVAAKR